MPDMSDFWAGYVWSPETSRSGKVDRIGLVNLG
jgi:hypothetical protein